MNRHFISTAKATSSIAALTVLFSAGIFSAGTATAAEGEAVRCLQTSQIRNTRIMDDQNIVFETSGNRFYNNHLPHKCSGLKSADKFSYTTSLSVLCNVDIITVLQGSGSSMMKGAGCGLGDFKPIPAPDRKENEKTN